ncbi:cytochrome c oxidase subunit 6b-1-like [Benincasa hispida]|uniref:cytochrome c oxidase subunit 6b-1-like n=1 Tax=Benincasa hispida TaxID=102211 RepID=UPI00190161B0|nr:cytochrome c oxidase subunit 6b-1-like [Benincasa hispida]
MAEAQSEKTPSLAEQYSLKEKEEKVDIPNPSEVKEVENSENAAHAEVVVKNDEPPVEAEANQGSDDSPAEENNGDAPAAAAVEDSETSPAAENDSGAADEESSGAGGEENSGDQESTDERPEIKLETAPADFRFPTTNQTRHCFTRYIEYHRCIQAKGEGAPECDKFAKYYRSLCPSEWVEKWNEQRENGTFPGPL